VYLTASLSREKVCQEERAKMLAEIAETHAEEAQEVAELSNSQ